MPSAPTAVSWSEAERLAKHHHPDSEVRLPKSAEPTLPPKYEPSPLSVPKGALSTYRGPGPGEHFQVREYDDYWTVDYDEFHPQHSPTKHAILEAPMYTALAIGVVGALLSSSSG